MAITLDDLKRDERTCTVEYNGQSAQVTYRPSGYTPEIEDRFQTCIESARSINGFAEFLANTLVNWELLDENGRQFPITLEDLRTLPGRFLTTVINAITSDMREERDDNLKNSGAGSSERKTRSRSARTGFR